MQSSYKALICCFDNLIGGDGQQEGLAGHRLGLAYEDVDDAETAILVINIISWFQINLKLKTLVFLISLSLRAQVILFMNAMLYSSTTMVI